MKYPVLVTIVVCFLCAGAWATREPQRMANESLMEATAVANYTEILKVPFQKDNGGMYALMTLSWNQKIREALNTVNWALKYVAAKLKRGVACFEQNLEILRDLHRRRQKALNVIMRAKERRIRKIKPGPPLKLSHQIKPNPMRWLPEPTLLSHLAVRINATTGQHFMAPKKTIVAMI